MRRRHRAQRLTAEKLKAAADACEQERAKAEAAIAAFRERVQKETASRAALAQKELALSDLVSDAERDIAEYSALLQQLEQKVAGLESEALSAAESEDVLNRIRTEAAAEAAARQQESGKLRQERDKLNEEIAALREESASFFRPRGGGRKFQAPSRRARNAARPHHCRPRGDGAHRVRTCFSQRAGGKGGAFRRRPRRHQRRPRRHLPFGGGKAQKGAEQEARSERKRALLEEQQQEDEKRHRSELEIGKAEAALENMKQRIDEAYGLSYESAQDMRDENYDVSQSYNNINSLKRKISALGPVNMNAEEDYELLFGRYSEMQSQKEDLERASSTSPPS